MLTPALHLAAAQSVDTGQQIAFGVIALAMIISAIRVVTTHNLVHAALYLTAVLAGGAGIYILLAAEFVATTQVLIYIGAVIVLMLFGLFLTRAPLGRDQDLDNNQRWIGAVVALLLLGVLGAVLQHAFKGTHVHANYIGDTAGGGSNTGAIGVAIFQHYVIPFEVASVVLLAALVGAVVIARRD
jgi:NADH-quinone oxidoreductase subunit J